ncbi:hypothetical protein ACHWQZ_G003442 [Mnemiopsis leidyi]
MSHKGSSNLNQVFKSEVLAGASKEMYMAGMEDKDHIRRVVNLEQILKQEQLNMEGAVKILQLYYTVGDSGDLEPIPKSSDKMFQKELLTANSKVLVEFKEDDDATSETSQVSLRTILKHFRLNPRLKLVQEVVLLGVTDRHLKYLINSFYPELPTQTFTKKQSKLLLTRLISGQKKKSSHPLGSKKDLAEAVKAGTAFLFRCLNEPQHLTARTVINILYCKPGAIEKIQMVTEPVAACPVLSNRPKITKRTEALRRYFSQPQGLQTAESLVIFQSSFLYPYLTNPPIFGNALIEILAHFRPNSKGLVDASELKPFFEALIEIRDYGFSSSGSGESTSCYKNPYKKRIKICELILALPLDEPLYEAFSLLFSPITGHFFMNLFRTYDADDSGDMDSEEALKMIKDMLENSVANHSVYSTRRKSLSPDLLVNLQSTACVVVQALFTCFGKNSVSLTDFGHFLNIQQNFLNKHMLRTGVNKSRHHELFKHYDQNDNGYVDGEEIAELVRDIVVTVNGDEADVIQEEVNVATSLLMWSQDSGNKITEEEVQGMIPRRTVCFTAQANSRCDHDDD